MGRKKGTGPNPPRNASSPAGQKKGKQLRPPPGGFLFFQAPPGTIGRMLTDGPNVAGDSHDAQDAETSSASVSPAAASNSTFEIGASVKSNGGFLKAKPAVKMVSKLAASSAPDSDAGSGSDAAESKVSPMSLFASIPRADTPPKTSLFDHIPVTTTAPKKSLFGSIPVTTTAQTDHKFGWQSTSGAGSTGPAPYSLFGRTDAQPRRPDSSLFGSSANTGDALKKGPFKLPTSHVTEPTLRWFGSSIDTGHAPKASSSTPLFASFGTQPGSVNKTAVDSEPSHASLFGTASNVPTFQAERSPSSLYVPSAILEVPTSSLFKTKPFESRAMKSDRQEMSQGGQLQSTSGSSNALADYQHSLRKHQVKAAEQQAAAIAHKSTPSKVAEPHSDHSPQNLHKASAAPAFGEPGPAVILNQQRSASQFGTPTVGEPGGRNAHNAHTGRHAPTIPSDNHAVPVHEVQQHPASTATIGETRQQHQRQQQEQGEAYTEFLALLEHLAALHASQADLDARRGEAMADLLAVVGPAGLELVAAPPSPAPAVAPSRSAQWIAIAVLVCFFLLFLVWVVDHREGAVELVRAVVNVLRRE